MLRIALIAAVVIASVAGTAAAATKDPRVCTADGKRSYGCAQYAAEKAIRAHVAAGTVNLYCKTTDPKLLRWSCRWGRTTVGHGTVRFYATHSGWHTAVTLT